MFLSVMCFVTNSIEPSNALSIMKVTYLKHHFQAFQSVINKALFSLQFLSFKRLLLENRERIGKNYG